MVRGKDEGGMMKDKTDAFGKSSYTYMNGVPGVLERTGLLYTVFPEEQNLEDIADHLVLTRKVGVALYIHKSGYAHCCKTISETRKTWASNLQIENPELFWKILNNTLPLEEEVNRIKSPRYIISFSEISIIFNEIMGTVDMLYDAQKYLNQLPDARMTTFSRHVRYHLSNYFNESFILLERLRKLLKTIEKLYQKDARLNEFKKHFKALNGIIDVAFKDLRQRRNYHVHEKRYSDDDLNRLEVLELGVPYKVVNLQFVEVTDTQIVNKMYTEETQKYHKQLVETTTDISGKTGELLNLFFGILERFLFSKQGDFIPPDEYRR